MKKLLLLLLLIPFITPVLAQNTTKKAVKSVEKILNEDDKGKGRTGKPLSPGAQGRTNAEIKKATNPGQGAGKDNSLGGALLDELIDDVDKKGKGKEGKKNGKKGKGKGKR
jgi:hypothetical protein